MTRIDPALQAHKDWIGFVKPVGLVVSPRALIDAQAQIDVRAAMSPQQILLDLTGEDNVRLAGFHRFTTDVLGWRDDDLAGGTELEPLAVVLPELGDTLAPTYAVRDAENAGHWQLLIVETPAGDDFDDEGTNALRGWTASHQARFERLLRERDVPIGILTNREVIRLVYAPRGESTGHVSFVVREMTEVLGRPILAALLMLLGEQRLFALPSNQRLPALLRQSRKYQSEVSERLAEQVLDSLWRLLYGFQAADEFSRGELLRDVLRRAPNDIYGGLLATIMRMVFTLYAEDRALLPVDSAIYAANYGLLGLFERLREDNSRYPDTMPQRFGAWAQLLTLFRLLHDGASHGEFQLPPRHGRLFDPDAYPFLEGRSTATRDAVTLPRISDAVVHGILDKLLYLDGDRLSYAALDVEEIGSVYEAMMGFRLEVTSGRSIGVKPKTKKGVRADVIVDLEALLAAKPAERAKLLKEEAGTEVSGKSLNAFKSATTPERIVDALGGRVSPFTPRILPKGTMALQPSEERRRSGSHYTPRSLTQPIVKTTLQPILDQLCGNPECSAFAVRNDPNRREPVPGCVVGTSDTLEQATTATEAGSTSVAGRAGHQPSRPEQILDLKVCDPAMGSGAFLVEACRFLGDALVRSWQIHGGVPTIPADEDIVLYARRRIAQQCLYGVDRNPFAVDLAKLSLWLATLAKDHPFTFLDHALRHGDSLVGLLRDQIVHFDWEDSDQLVLELSGVLNAALAEAEAKRERIRELSDSDDTDEKQRLLADAELATRVVRTAGDLLVSAFFGAEKDRDRKALRASTLDALRDAIRTGTPIDERPVSELRSGTQPLPPFHWFLEFPEVFSRSNPGFDAFVGNPPFAGKNTLIKSNRDAYPAWLKVLHEETHGNADLIAQFFRRVFNLTRTGGTFGLIATNTIAQGDTRGTGLRWICKHGGTIYEARKRVKWPGAAAVVVSVIHVRRGPALGAPRLNGRAVERITAFLFHAGGHDDPRPLRENAGKSFQGSIVLGMGFTFDDDNDEATPIVEMHRLIEKDPKNAQRIFPYIGGEEINESPTHSHRRYVIDFFDRSLADASEWPDLIEIVRRKVKPDRDGQKRDANRERWWQYAEKRPGLYAAIRELDRVLVCARHQERWALAFARPGTVFSDALVVFALSSVSAFGLLQSRLHESWCRFFGSSLEERFRYTPTDCFETFPFPIDLASLEGPAREYHDFRQGLMCTTNQGLTRIYGRFDDPYDRDTGILRLRELHDSMDRAVLKSYGWTDIQPVCDFIPDYQIDESSETTSEDETAGRYRWPDDIRDEVLARLLALNAERAKQEQLASAAVVPTRAKTRSRKPVAVPLFERTTPVALPATAHLRDGAWARPRANAAGEEKAMLVAILKALPSPTPTQIVRLAHLLAMEPWLLAPQLSAMDATEWKRLVGAEATAPAGQKPEVRAEWGRALSELRALGRLIASDDNQTWRAGPGLDAVETRGWPDGRAGIVLRAIAQRDAGAIITILPAASQEWVKADVAA